MHSDTERINPRLEAKTRIEGGVFHSAMWTKMDTLQSEEGRGVFEQRGCTHKKLI